MCASCCCIRLVAEVDTPAENGRGGGPPFSHVRVVPAYHTLLPDIYLCVPILS